MLPVMETVQAVDAQRVFYDVPQDVLGYQVLCLQTDLQLMELESQPGVTGRIAIDEQAMTLQGVREFLLSDKVPNSTRANEALERQLEGSQIQSMGHRPWPLKTNWLKTFAEKFDDDQLITYLEWNASHTSEAQAKLDQHVPEMLGRFEHRIYQAVLGGWLPAEALDGLEQLERVRFNAGDVFMTTAQEADAFYDYRGRTKPADIFLSSEIINGSPEHLEHVLTHELIHAIAGKAGPKRGLNNDRGRSQSWLDEALTEQVTLTLLGYTTLNEPDSNPSGCYYHERVLLTTLGINQAALKLYFGTNYPALEKQIERMEIFFGEPVYDQALTDYKNPLKSRLAMQRLTRIARQKLTADPTYQPRHMKAA